MYHSQNFKYIKSTSSKLVAITKVLHNHSEKFAPQSTFKDISMVSYWKQPCWQYSKFFHKTLLTSSVLFVPWRFSESFCSLFCSAISFWAFNTRQRALMALSSPFSAISRALFTSPQWNKIKAASEYLPEKKNRKKYVITVSPKHLIFLALLKESTCITNVSEMYRIYRSKALKHTLKKDKVFRILKAQNTY